ncbi:MAG: hypothetical protein IJN79_03445, partial [Clostridia bacterium]|nr:hypothetical protein [Clostridia bacterium]
MSAQKKRNGRRISTFPAPDSAAFHAHKKADGIMPSALRIYFYQSDILGDLLALLGVLERIAHGNDQVAQAIA